MSGASFDFLAVSVPSTDAEALAAKLTERSADGWEVVSVVSGPAGFTAFCRRPVGASSGLIVATAGAAEAAATDEAPLPEPGPAPAEEPAAEPAADAAPAEEAPATAPPRTGDLDSGWATIGTPQESTSPHAASHFGGQGHAHAPSPVGAPTPAVRTEAAPAAEAPSAPPVQQPATPQVPAGWYSDPSGRFELRYWDGNEWTEHVARNGQQYTDAPVP